MSLSAVVDSASTYSWSKHARNQAEEGMSECEEILVGNICG